MGEKGWCVWESLSRRMWLNLTTTTTTTQNPTHSWEAYSRHKKILLNRNIFSFKWVGFYCTSINARWLLSFPLKLCNVKIPIAYLCMQHHLRKNYKVIMAGSKKRNLTPSHHWLLWRNFYDFLKLENLNHQVETSPNQSFEWNIFGLLMPLKERCQLCMKIILALLYW